MKDANVHYFGVKLGMSRGGAVGTVIDDFLLNNLPGAVRITESLPGEDRQGVDKWVELVSGKRVGIDVKIGREAFAHYDTLPLETWSVMEKGIMGWTLDPNKWTDYVLWHWINTRKFVLVPFLMLQKVFSDNAEEWKQQYRVAQQYTPSISGGWHSECVFVPIGVVQRAMSERFGLPI